MLSMAACRTEIETLHQFFVGWYTGQLPDEAFSRAESALAPSFEIISPDGERRDREASLAAIRNSFGTYGPAEFEIEIRNVEVVERWDDRALVRYEEWQHTEATTGRLSTVLFAPARESTPDEQQLEWRYLQETWLAGNN